MKTLYEVCKNLQSVIKEKNRLKEIYLNEWDNLQGERKSRLLDAIGAANQSIAIIRLELLNRRVKVNRVMPNSHFFYIDTEGIIEDIDIEGNSLRFRADGMNEEFGLAWLSAMCLDFTEETKN